MLGRARLQYRQCAQNPPTAETHRQTLNAENHGERERSCARSRVFPFEKRANMPRFCAATAQKRSRRVRHVGWGHRAAEPPRGVHCNSVCVSTPKRYPIRVSCAFRPSKAYDAGQSFFEQAAISLRIARPRLPCASKRRVLFPIGTKHQPKPLPPSPSRRLSECELSF